MITSIRRLRSQRSFVSAKILIGMSEQCYGQQVEARIQEMGSVINALADHHASRTVCTISRKRFSAQPCEEGMAWLGLVVIVDKLLAHTIFGEDHKGL